MNQNRNRLARRHAKKTAAVALGLGLSAALGLSGCGIVYQSPSVKQMTSDASKVRVVPITAESTMLANRSSYTPQTLPAVFSQTAGYGSGLRGAGAVPEPVVGSQVNPGALETRVPPKVTPQPYRIGVGDVLLLATPAGSTIEQLSGLLAAQNQRQGYTVQDDGSIAIPNVGRVQVAGQTLEDAEATLFQRLVENNIDPTFSLEISEFNSKRISVGGAVGNPTVEPITLTPLYLDEALAAAGGVQTPDRNTSSIRIYRDGTLYQIPLSQFYSRTGLQRIQLIDGDSVFVDTEYQLDLAKTYFEQQITLAQYKQQARIQALNELNAEINIRRGNLEEARQNFRSRQELDGVKRDYVYISGEVKAQSRYALPFGQTASLADALYGEAGGVPTITGNVSQIYVLRGSDDPREFGAVTAWQLNGKNAANMVLATKFELRPNDIIFVAEQPVTKWNRVIQQITPSLINTTVGAATN